MPKSEIFNLPDAGEGLTEADIITWLVKAGDTVEVNQPICEIETAKSLVELPSPYDGSFHGILPLGGDAVLAFGLRGNLFRSEDGGSTWAQVATGTTALLNAGAQIDADTVVVVGMAGVVLVSRDGGRSFTLHQQDDRKALSAVVPSGDGALIVAGEGGVRRLALPAGGTP